jgi:citronellyl-CoA dehydrogenase
MWIANGDAGGLVLPSRQHFGSAVHQNKSLIAVPMDAKGISRRKIRKIGMNSTGTAQFFFDEVRVPRKNVVARKGWGPPCK